MSRGLPARRGIRDGGLATLEATMVIALVVPLLFAVIAFGDAFQRWLGQSAAAVQAARYAGEVGGDTPEVRALLADALRSAGVDPGRASVEIEPARVGWREPIRVSVRSEARLAIPFLFDLSVPLRSTAISRGEVAQ